MLSFDHLEGINTLLASLLNKNSMAICLSERTPENLLIINKTKAELLPTTPTFLNMLLISKYIKKKISVV